jgi:hypothetical protein
MIANLFLKIILTYLFVGKIQVNVLDVINSGFIPFIFMTSVDDRRKEKKESNSSSHIANKRPDKQRRFL